MKKLAICALSAFILISSLAGCGTPSAEPSPTPSAAPLVEYDWDGAYAAYAPDTVVMTINGDPVTWDEYFAVLYNEYVAFGYGNELSYYVENAGMTLEDFLASDVELYCLQKHTIEQVAREHNVNLTADDEAVLAEELSSDIEQYVGSDGTEQELYDFLAKQFISPEFYEYEARMRVLYPRIFIELYGAEGGQVTDEEALAFADEYNFVNIKHILFKTLDDDNQPLSDEEKAAKLSEAQAVLDELNAVPESERAALFDKLMDEKSEDTGLASYPDGYNFEAGAGIMVQEFEDAAENLAVGEISDIVESPYGYHILMRGELGPDDKVMLSSTEAYPLRYVCANFKFNRMLSDWAASAEISYAEGFEDFRASEVAKEIS